MSSRNSSPARSASTRLTRNSSSRSSNDVKSSGFYPTPMSPTARMAIVEHMDSHYRRLQKVKAVVDTTPPKSYQLSRSSSPSRSCSSRANSRSSLRTNESQFTQVNRQEVLQSTNRINYYLEAMRREQQRLFSQLAAPNFRRSKVNSTVSACVMTNRLKHHDLMERHADNFTNPEHPFVPRVLKSNAKSKLRENRWYNPPRRREFKRADSNDEFDEYEKDWEDDFSDRSVTAPARKINAKEYKGDVDVGDSKKYFNKWLDDQVYVSENRMKVLGGSSSQEIDHNGNIESSSAKSKNDISKHIQGESSPVKRDELPYLQFIVDVTNDILIRGIYTNKVLKQVFASHLERRKHELKMDQMEAALKQLQIDLGITDDCEISSMSFGYGRQSATHNGYKQKDARESSLINFDLDKIVALAGVADDSVVADGQRGGGSSGGGVSSSSVVPQSGASRDRASSISVEPATKSNSVMVDKVTEELSQVSDGTYDKETFESESEESTSSHGEHKSGDNDRQFTQMDRQFDAKDTQFDDFY